MNTSFFLHRGKSKLFSFIKCKRQVALDIRSFSKLSCLTRTWSKSLESLEQEKTCDTCSGWWTQVGRDLERQPESHFIVPARCCRSPLIADCPSFSPAAARFHFHVVQPHSPAPPLHPSSISPRLFLALSVSYLSSFTRLCPSCSPHQPPFSSLSPAPLLTRGPLADFMMVMRQVCLKKKRAT